MVGDARQGNSPLHIEALFFYPKDTMPSGKHYPILFPEIAGILLEIILELRDSPRLPRELSFEVLLD